MIFQVFCPDLWNFSTMKYLGKKKFIRDLSKGNQKKVGVVGALMGHPELVVLDEPFANLDPSSQFKLRKIIKEFGFGTRKNIS